MLLRKRNAWLFALAFALGSLALVWQHKLRLGYEERGLLGDGKHLDSYGFDLSAARVGVEDIVPSGVSRDGLRSLDLPPLLDPAALDSVQALGRKPFLLDHDRVLGLVLDGRARAYPLSILNWHEVVNDTLDGQPVLITWNPLCGSACAYSRRGDGEAPEFGVSGLFHNSNLLLYDRVAAGEESLWSQLTGAALAGPAAAREDSLRRLPLVLTRWDDWRERHPSAAVLAPDPVWLKQKYRRRPYVSYEGSDRLQYPVRPLPETGEGVLPLKAAMLRVDAGGVSRLYPLPLIAERADASGLWRTKQAGVQLIFRHWPGDPAVAAVRTPHGEALVSTQAYWFAWYSQWPAASEARVH